MMQKIRVLLLVCITAVLAACGGGGGDETPNFAGNYFETFSLTTNSCNLSIQNTFTGTDAVAQNGRNINIASGGYAFTGSVDADNGGFTVNSSAVSGGITTLATISYRTIDAGSKYSINFKLVANGCTAIYTGTATKI